jgi:hypothetical protein
MGVEVTPMSHEIAALDLAPEYGIPTSLVINREIAEFLIAELRGFLDPSTRETN